MNEDEMNQSNLLEHIWKSNNKSKPKTKEGNDKTRNIFDCIGAFYEGWELNLNAFSNGIFLINEKQGKGKKL